VTGHVDGVGRIRKIARAGKNRRFFVEAGPAILKYAVLKGSMALDGVSLTVQEVSPGGFWVALVPHTLAVTTLREKKTGDAVNLEIDLMARYPETEQKPGKWRPSGLSVKALKAQGF